MIPVRQHQGGVKPVLEQGGRRLREGATVVCFHGTYVFCLVLITAIVEPREPALYEKPNLLLLEVWLLFGGLASVTLARFAFVALQAGDWDEPSLPTRTDTAANLSASGSIWRSRRSRRNGGRNAHPRDVMEFSTPRRRAAL